MAKILLINPPLTKEEIYSKYGVVSAVLPPLGLCYIAAVLEKDNHKIKIIDGVAEKVNQQQIIQRIKKFNPDIIGLTAMTVAYNRAIEIAKQIKNFNKDLIILLGGPHVSSVPRKVFEGQNCFDIGIFGEGEYTAQELINYLEKRKFKDYKAGLKKIKGLIFKNNKKIIQTPKRELIKNLDELPLPARHLLPNIKLYNLILMNQEPNFASIVPSRGCPFHCIYCDQNVFGHNWRYFSAEYMIKEVEELVNKYGVKTLQIQDDLFTLKRERMTKFCELLLKRNIKIKWNLSSRVNLIDEKLARMMKKAGCEIVYFGIESGDQEVLNKIKKGITLEQARKGVEIAKKTGLSPHGSFILGLPFDTKETIEKTINFAKSLPLDIVSFHIATPYPNTEFEKIAKHYGVIHITDYSQYRGHPDQIVFTPKNISERYLLKKQKQAYRKFYLRLKIILKKILEVKSPKKFVIYFKGALTLLKK